MRIFFIHQNMPAQFKHLAPALAQLGHEIIFLTRRNDRDLPGVRRITYSPHGREITSKHRYVRTFEEAVLSGQQVARVCLQLKSQNLSPDLIIAHPGWGESLFVKDIFPNVPVISYSEFYYNSRGADVGFDPEFPSNIDDECRLRARNAHLLLALQGCDAGISPTQWQWKQHPSELRSKIAVIFDGVDTNLVKPRAGATFTLPDGRMLSPEDEVITYVARQLEPYRGYHTFIRALPEILRRRPNALVVIVGGDGVSYGRAAPNGVTWREHMAREVEYDQSRVFHVGMLPYDSYLDLLRISSLHVYLTVPFTLSWSFFEAMSAGCLVLGSSTAPVKEVLVEEVNGLLCEFSSPEDIAERAIQALGARASLEDIRLRARQIVLGSYDIKLCLRQQIALIERVAG